MFVLMSPTTPFMALHGTDFLHNTICMIINGHKWQSNYQIYVRLNTLSILRINRYIDTGVSHVGYFSFQFTNTV